MNTVKTLNIHTYRLVQVCMLLSVPVSLLVPAALFSQAHQNAQHASLPTAEHLVQQAQTINSAPVGSLAPLVEIITRTTFEFTGLVCAAWLLHLLWKKKGHTLAFVKAMHILPLTQAEKQGLHEVASLYWFLSAVLFTSAVFVNLAVAFQPCWNLFIEVMPLLKGKNPALISATLDLLAPVTFFHVAVPVFVALIGGMFFSGMGSLITFHLKLPHPQPALAPDPLTSSLTQGDS